jgi:hypothetical protein
MKFSVSILATIEAASIADAAVQADRVKGLLQNPLVGNLLRTSGVKMVGTPSVSKPEEKK